MFNLCVAHSNAVKNDIYILMIVKKQNNYYIIHDKFIEIYELRIKITCNPKCLDVR